MMRWKIASEPKVGDVRFKRKFAWFPVRVKFRGESCYIWLEHYLATQQFTEIVVREGMFSYCKLKWLTVKKDLS